MAQNRIGPIAMDTNVDTTFEGDNTILMQQVAKVLVAEKPSADAMTPLVPPGKPLQELCIAQLLQLRCAWSCCSRWNCVGIRTVQRLLYLMLQQLLWMLQYGHISGGAGRCYMYDRVREPSGHPSALRGLKDVQQ